MQSTDNPLPLLGQQINLPYSQEGCRARETGLPHKGKLAILPLSAHASPSESSSLGQHQKKYSCLLADPFVLL